MGGLWSKVDKDSSCPLRAGRGPIYGWFEVFIDSWISLLTCESFEFYLGYL